MFASLFAAEARPQARRDMQIQRVTNHTGNREQWLVKHRVEVRSRTGVARAGKATAGLLNYSAITARSQGPVHIVLYASPNDS